MSDLDEDGAARTRSTRPSTPASSTRPGSAATASRTRCPVDALRRGPPDAPGALHQRVGAAIEAAHAGALDDHLGELAHHYARSAGAGDTAKAVEFARRAGELALAQLAHDDAVVVLRTGRRAARRRRAMPSGARCCSGLGVARRARRRPPVPGNAPRGGAPGGRPRRRRPALPSGVGQQPRLLQRDRCHRRGAHRGARAGVDEIGPEDSATRARLLAEPRARADLRRRPAGSARPE